MIYWEKVQDFLLYQFLGGQDNQVETDMTISIDTPEVMAENAQLFVEQGFTALKIKSRIG